jgi:hypothetical protein
MGKFRVMVFFTAVTGLMVAGWTLSRAGGADKSVVEWFEGAVLLVLALFLVAAIVNRMWEP